MFGPKLDKTQIHIKKQSQLQKKEKKKTNNSVNNRWTFEQNTLYFRFVRANAKRLHDDYINKKYFKFKKMSVVLGSRNPAQCRSHHQKMLKKYGSLQKLIDQFPQLTLRKGSSIDTRCNEESVGEEKGMLSETEEKIMPQEQIDFEREIRQPFQNCEIIQEKQAQAGEVKKKEDDIFDCLF